MQADTSVSRTGGGTGLGLGLALTLTLTLTLTLYSWRWRRRPRAGYRLQRSIARRQVAPRPARPGDTARIDFDQPGLGN